MTNLDRDGDKHIRIDYIDKSDILNYFKVILNPNSESYYILNEKKYPFNELNITREVVEKFSRLCLGEFRRGYDKPDY